jgi:hypothetical protein
MNLRTTTQIWNLRTILLLACFLFIASAGRSLAAGYKTIIGGITVSYSLPGASAYWDTNDNTLTISIGQSGGSLSVSVGSTAYASWGNGVDIYILADNASFKSISIKGTPACWAYVCGDVYYTSKFAMTDGVVGNTLAYGPDFGLGMAAPSAPTSISLKNSWTTAQLLGYPNQ